MDPDRIRELEKEDTELAEAIGQALMSPPESPEPTEWDTLQDETVTNAFQGSFLAARQFKGGKPKEKQKGQRAKDQSQKPLPPPPKNLKELKTHLLQTQFY